MDYKKMQRFLCLAATLFAAGVILYLSARWLLRWLLPFLLALLLSAASEPVISFCHSRLHFRRAYTAAVCTLLTVGILSSLLFFLIRALLTQVTSLLSRLPSLLATLPTFVAQLQARIAQFSARCPDTVNDWLSAFLRDASGQVMASATDLSARWLSSLTSLVSFLPEAALFLVTTVLAMYYTSARYPEIRAFLRRQIPPHKRRGASGVKQNICSTMLKWLRAQGILWLLTFSILFAGLLLLRVRYALLLAFLIAFVDMLPVLGTGTVLVPWALISLLLQRAPLAVGLAALQVILLLERSILEPKLVAAQVNLPPIAALLAIYLGYCSMGIFGMVTFPILLLLIKQLHDENYLKLWK